MGAFNDRVYEVVRQIPYGCVSTYGDIARAIGQPRKALFVGYAMRSSMEEGAVPCHRVVYKDGHIYPTDDEGQPTVQKIMLEREGVPFVDESHVDLDACHSGAHGCRGPSCRHRLGCRNGRPVLGVAPRG